MKKQAAIPPEVMRSIIGAIVGGVGGGVTGYELTPRMGGYEDVESARRSAGLMHGLTGAVLGGMIRHPAGLAALKDLGAKGVLSAGPVLLAEEALPMGLATMKRQQEASQAATEASRTGSIPVSIQKALSSPTAGGAGVGVAGAGLAALVTGLMRRKSEDELTRRKTRGQMVTSDFLKYVVPAMAAGGVVGSMRKTR